MLKFSCLDAILSRLLLTVCEARATAASNSMEWTPAFILVERVDALAWTINLPVEFGPIRKYGR
jgi:hypothetical protein